MLRSALLLLICLSALPAWADEVYQAPGAFVSEAFDGHPPEAAQLWITGSLREQVAVVLGHAPVARLRYWRHGPRTAWILEETGKERPITTGLVVEGNHLLRIKVLVYRESRGSEVRLPAFTRQFEGAELRVDSELDRGIDNISGATLSVNALRKLARLCLLLHREVLASAAIAAATGANATVTQSQP